jgi:predicted RNase H-like HicB family nuclease
LNGLVFFDIMKPMSTKNQFTAVFKKTKSWFIGWIEEIPGVNTQGATLNEVRDNLREALLLIVGANKSNTRKLAGRSHSIRRERLNINIPA